ncbi:MAG: HI0074 family nucleotidyltransferase substrate-binding subunit [Candidatus Gracilibacteria bacterium]|nr:HI0074 family nucleotidyltransferase substrate-binding subunit [Candidatus Gracilibacteria bacterium]MDQ7022189.1 HI0074 family nucleotidyltransferase substrate-binding subunit [Candidatus Gracilibacteria bacterium]
MELKRLQKQILLCEKANKSLQKVFVEQDIFSELEKDGVIQRFEYTVEISWKTLKKVLEYNQLNFSPAPKEIIRESYKLDYIDSLDLWDEFLDIRNQMSHVYSDFYSKDNFDFIKLNAGKITETIEILKKKFI